MLFKKLTSVILAVLLMLPSVNRLGILIDFKINQEFIATVLCINKEEPVPTCNGKCHLSKLLEKAEEPGEKQAPNSKNNKLELLFVASNFDSSIVGKSLNDTSKQNSFYAKNLRHFNLLNEVFHPPKNYSM